MSRALRAVPRDVWSLGDKIAWRHTRLLDVPSPDELLALLHSESVACARAGRIVLTWKPGVHAAARSFKQVMTQIRLEAETFDQFFNGRSGYRAQYYLSPEEGVLYNRDVLQALREAIVHGYSLRPLDDAPLDLVLASLDGPHAKVWVHGEKEAFREAEPKMVNPPRWVEADAYAGRKAPLPKDPLLDVKGALIHPETREVWVDPWKENRACELHQKGYT